jgi:ketosteroid isomerase-like protein
MDFHPSHRLTRGARTPTPDEAAVLQAMEALSQACLAASRAELAAITAAELSYSHSDGHIQSQEEFIASLESGRSGFRGIELREVCVQLAGPIALVQQHALYATWNGGEPGSADLQVSQVWRQDDDGVWRLLLRLAHRTQPLPVTGG